MAEIPTQRLLWILTHLENMLRRSWSLVLSLHHPHSRICLRDNSKDHNPDRNTLHSDLRNSNIDHNPIRMLNQLLKDTLQVNLILSRSTLLGQSDNNQNIHCHTELQFPTVCYNQSVNMWRP